MRNGHNNVRLFEILTPENASSSQECPKQNINSGEISNNHVDVFRKNLDRYIFIIHNTLGNASGFPNVDPEDHGKNFLHDNFDIDADLDRLVAIVAGCQPRTNLQLGQPDATSIDKSLDILKSAIDSGRLAGILSKERPKIYVRADTSIMKLRQNHKFGSSGRFASFEQRRLANEVTRDLPLSEHELFIGAAKPARTNIYLLSDFRKDRAVATLETASLPDLSIHAQLGGFAAPVAYSPISQLSAEPSASTDTGKSVRKGKGSKKIKAPNKLDMKNSKKPIDYNESIGKMKNLSFFELLTGKAQSSSGGKRNFLRNVSRMQHIRQQRANATNKPEDSKAGRVFDILTGEEIVDFRNKVIDTD